MNRNDLLHFSVSSLCRGVDVLDLEKLLSGVQCRVEVHSKGSLVLMAGARYDELWVLLEGSVTAQMRHPAGKVITIETIDAPDPIAPAILFAPQSCLPVSVSAASYCRFMVLPLEAVLDLCQRDRRFLINFLKEIGGKLSLFADKFKLLEFSSLRKRIAVYLAPRLKDWNVELDRSKEELADLFSVTRPSLSRELAAMAEEGLLAVDGRLIRILDPERFNDILFQDT